MSRSDIADTETALWAIDDVQPGPSEISDVAEREDAERKYVPRGEGEAGGWIRVGRYDSARRRALWVRFVGLDDYAYPTSCTAIELCAGREGDDADVRIESLATGFSDLLDVMLRAADHIPARWREFDRKAAEEKGEVKP